MRRVLLEMRERVIAMDSDPAGHRFGPSMKALANQHDSLRAPRS